MSGEGRRFSDDKLQEFYDEFREHAVEEKKRLESIMQAFPDGDADGHRKYHESVMRAAEAQEKFWTELRLDVAKKGVMGLLVILCGLILAGVATKFGLTVKP